MTLDNEGLATPEAPVTDLAGLTDNWLKDGEAHAEPVTSETPALPAAEPAAPAPPAEPAPADTPTAAEIEMIEAMLDDKPFKLPKNVRLPLKRGDKVEYEPLEQVQRERMLKRDYDARMAERAERDRQYAAERARFQVEQEALKKERDDFLAAHKDPEAYQRFVEHQQRYADDPEYRKTYDDAMAGRTDRAELELVREEREQAEVEREAQTVVGWIQDAATRFPGVDAKRVQGVYAMMLETGRAQGTPTEIEELFKREAAYIAASPAAQRLEKMQQQIDELTEKKAADAHNAITDHAVARAAKPPTAPAGGGAPAPAPPPKGSPIRSRDGLDERGNAWATES